jgi:hypothetical protein
LLIPAQGTANAANLIGGNGLTIAAPAQDDAFIAGAVSHGLGGGANVIRVIHGVDAVGPEIPHLDPALTQVLNNLLFIRETRVITADGNFHGVNEPVKPVSSQDNSSS